MLEIYGYAMLVVSVVSSKIICTSKFLKDVQLNMTDIKVRNMRLGKRYE